MSLNPNVYSDQSRRAAIFEGFETVKDENKKEKLHEEFREKVAKVLRSIDVSLKDAITLLGKTKDINDINNLLDSLSIPLSEGLSGLDLAEVRKTLLPLSVIVDQFKGPILKLIDGQNSVVWDGPWMAGFKGEVVVLDITKETERDLLTHVIFAAALYSISLESENTYLFCMRLERISEKNRQYFRVKYIKDIYRCLSLRDFTDEIRSHLPVMISSRKKLDEYFVEGVLAQEIEKDMEMLSM